ncbi:MAG TPA: preprotein translocase subunit SecY [Verrucomicrobiae bacterium]|nr:preprotein translocase subunit SecY [Verrucomicrobiae bacterium]
MLGSIVQTFTNCFKIPELKSRIFFTVLLLAICRLVAYLPVPGLDGGLLREFFRKNASGDSGALGMYNLFTGGALEQCAVGALGIMPYISATIIIQLLTAVLPQLSKLAREEGGRTKIIQYGRYLTVLLCIIQGGAMAFGWENPSKIFGADIGRLVLYGEDPLSMWWYRIQTVLVLTTGTMLLMWLGEQITERGIGNGVSLVITVGILARLPQAFSALKDMFFPGSGVEPTHTFGHAAVLAALMVLVIAGVIAVTQAQRKIPVQYAQRAVGRKVYSGGTSFMPLRVNYAGVMPVIFASAILMFPQKFFIFLAGSIKTESGGFAKFAADTCRSIGVALDAGSVTYLVLFGLMILFFSYFWVATQFNELQIADDLKKNGGYIPGVRPGPATSDYLHNTMSRITLAGAIFLTIIAVIPIVMQNLLKIPPTVTQFFGGTSMLITVGVMLDTMRQVESHLLMRHYDGFLKKGKLRGRL